MWNWIVRLDFKIGGSGLLRFDWLGFERRLGGLGAEMLVWGQAELNRSFWYNSCHLNLIAKDSVPMAMAVSKGMILSLA